MTDQRWQPTDEQCDHLFNALTNPEGNEPTGSGAVEAIIPVIAQIVASEREKWTADTIARMEVSVEVYRKQCERAEKAEARLQWLVDTACLERLLHKKHELHGWTDSIKFPDGTVIERSKRDA